MDCHSARRRLRARQARRDVRDKVAIESKADVTRTSREDRL
jgi:hypothetical protein